MTPTSMQNIRTHPCGLVGDNAVMIFRTEQEQEAIRLLQTKGVNVIDGQHRYTP